MNPTHAARAGALLLAAACADGASDADPTDVAAPPGVSCDADLPGPRIDPVVESAEDYRARLDALDPAAFPDEIDLKDEDEFTRGIVSYMLEGPWRDRRTKEALMATPLGHAVLASVVVGGNDGTLDLDFLRQGLHTFYNCERGYPATLDGFVTRFGDYAQWPSHTVDDSQPKAHPRRVFADPQGIVWVAETLVGERVRETEILVSGERADGSLDFVAYSEAGDLTNRSTFAMGPTGKTTSSSPYTCMACHVNTRRYTYDVIVPE